MCRGPHSHLPPEGPPSSSAARLLPGRRRNTGKRRPIGRHCGLWRKHGHLGTVSLVRGPGGGARWGVTVRWAPRCRCRRLKAGPFGDSATPPSLSATPCPLVYPLPHVSWPSPERMSPCAPLPARLQSRTLKRVKNLAWSRISQTLRQRIALIKPFNLSWSPTTLELYWRR